MKKQWKKGCLVAVCMMIGILFMGLQVCAARHHENYKSEDLFKAIERTVQWKKESLKIPEEEGVLNRELLLKAGTEIGDWYTIAAGRMGLEEDYVAYQALISQMVDKKYREEDGLDKSRVTEWHRISLALLASGADPTDVGESHRNLIEDGVYNRSKKSALDAEGIEGVIWGLLTLDALRYQVPEDAADTRADLIGMLLEKQLSDGGFSKEGSDGELRTTCEAVMALAPYYHSEETYYYTRKSSGETSEKTVKEVIDEALGYMTNVSIENSQSAAQIIGALSALGIDVAEDERFIDRKQTLLDVLMSFQTEKGGFAASDPVNDEADDESSIQAICALNAYLRYQKGMRNFFDFREEQSEELKKQIQGLDEEIQKKQKTEITVEGVMELYQQYQNIPEEERSYVSAWPLLKENMNDFEIAGDGEYLAKSMEKNHSGKGSVTDLNDPSNKRTIEIHFTKEEEKAAEQLLEKVSLEEKIPVFKAIYQMQQSENGNKKLLKQLKKAKGEILEKQKEIDTINELIKETVYPFDKIGMDDKAVLDDLMSRCQTLTAYEKEQITYYDSVEKASTKLNKQLHVMTVSGIVSSIALFSAVLLFIFGKMGKKKLEDKKKK